MSMPLCKKYISEGLLLFVGLAIGVFVFCWFRVWIVGELDTAQFRQIIDLLPKDWRKFASVDFDWLVSYLGRTSLALDEPMLISLVCGWGLVRGSDVVSGEVSRGTMEMLLAQPISRRQVYWQHAWMTVLFLGLLVLLVWAGMSIGIATTSVEETTYPEIRIPLIDYRIPLSFLTPRTETIAMASEVNPMMFLPGILNLFCLGVCFSGFAGFCSAWDRYRWRTLGIVTAFYFFNAALKMLGMGSDDYSWAQRYSLFGLYRPAYAIQQADANSMSAFQFFEYGENAAIIGLGAMGNCLTLLILGFGFYVAGSVVFSRRDLPAPV